MSTHSQHGYSYYDISRILELKGEGSWKIGIRRYSTQPYSDIEAKINDLLSGNPSVVGVSGVPGAGKTTFYAYVLAKQLKDRICQRRQEGDLYVYIAPTNDLVIDFLEKFVQILKGAFDVECPPEILAKRIRAYGSKIESRKYSEVLKTINDEVILVAATEWQRVAARLGRSQRRQYYLIDEASRMTFTKLFISIADEIASRRGWKNIQGFVVIGDENQAIGINRVERRHLLLEKIRRLSESGSEGVHHLQLDHSFRLPKGAEMPIKEGYYEGRLRALGQPILLNCESECIKGLGEKCRGLAPTLEELSIIARKSPLVHIELSNEFRPTIDGITFDEKRARIAWCLAQLLSCCSRKRIVILTPYVGMSFAIRLVGNLPGNVRAATVSAYLGREDDIVIAVFGKERAAECKTFYLKDPYLLNVQLSRHRGALYTMGSAEKLINSANYCLGNKRGDIREAGWEKMRRALQTLLENGDMVIRLTR
ncbi:DEAD/DEAH box helicase [Pyrobaculum sp.]|uniref:DEAD/DEAH box helicase n=1 Tax=Pyrobaculum sp. TaxID=2004705 RepID=UPI003177999B